MQDRLNDFWFRNIKLQSLSTAELKEYGEHKNLPQFHLNFLHQIQKRTLLHHYSAQIAIQQNNIKMATTNFSGGTVTEAKPKTLVV